MTESALQRFFAPRAAALVGATPDLSKFGGRCLRQAIDFGFSGDLFPVNPRYDTLEGLRCFASVRDLPVAPDHVGIVVPAERVLATLEDCSIRGVPFATVFTSGFGETGAERGREMQRDIADFARRSGMRIMGPNCNGLINFVDGFALTSTSTISGPRKAPGPIGVVAHSGGVGQVNVMWRAQELGLGVGYEVSCGNDADLDALDFVDFMLDDPTIRVVLLVAERISNGKKFFTVARKAAAKQKPIVVLKFGRTEAGARAASSHTGAITGSDTVNDAAFRQAGVIRVDDCDELYQTGMLLCQGRWPRSNRASGVSISGGNVVLLSEIGAMNGIDWPPYAPETEAVITQGMPGFGKVANPTDLTAGAVGTGNRYLRVLEAIAADPNVDVVVPILTAAPNAEIEQVAAFALSAPKPVAVLWTGPGRGNPPLTPFDLIARGVPVYRETTTALKAVRAAMDYGQFLAAGDVPPTRPAGIDAAAARNLLQGRSGTLTERESKALLAAYGIPITREGLAETAEAAAALAHKIGGKLAMKIESPDIPHKTEAKAIRLNVAPEQAATAFADIMAAARAYNPNARLNGVLVQEMVPPGVEMILGIATDPVFGPVIVAGLGGIFVEVLHDVAHRIPPLDTTAARSMLNDLRGVAMLHGVRGAPPSDIDALVDRIVRLSWLARDLPEIAELDINPLVVGPAGQGAHVVDALVRLAETQP
jgi:acyl-CoA synthetase (NDP forming)